MKANTALLILCAVTGWAASAPAAETAAATPAAAADPNAVIPLIVIDDLPLNDAIRNLARQAGLNYLMDPKVAFGVPGADGKVVPQPNVSIRWEKVTAQQALEALLNNYGLQLIEDPKTGISRVTVKDPAAPDPLVTKIVQLKYASPSNIVSAVQTTLTDKRSKVVPDLRTSQLVVVATDKEHLAVTTLVESLDKPTRQVLIEARLMEISRNPSTVKGIDWSGTLEAQRVTFGNGLAKGETTTTIPGFANTTTLPGGRTVTTRPGQSEVTTISTLSGLGGVAANTMSGFTPSIGFLSADGASAVISFLNKDADTQVIATPRAVTLDNETAKISVTRAYPIFRVQASTQNTTGGSQVEYTNLGTILEVTPRISANDQIHLKVIPEVSSIFRTVRKVVQDTVNEADEYDIRKIETQVMIPSANTLVLGGLMADATKNAYSKVPILGDLPYIGLAFRHEKKEQDKKNLLIFITPTIVKDTDYTPTETTFLKSKAIQVSGSINPNSPWESAKPKDWSNPEGMPQEEAVYDEDDTLLNPGLKK